MGNFQLVEKFFQVIQSCFKSFNECNKQNVSLMFCRTMITGRTVCFVCLVLFLGTTHAETTTENQNVSSNGTKTIEDQTTQVQQTNKISETPNHTNHTNQVHVCTQSTPKPTQENGFQRQCILFYPEDKTLFLVVGGLVLACFVLLLTTLMCAWQFCHLKVLISRFQPHSSKVDLYAMRRRSESSYRDDGQAVREPNETCPMLTQVTTQEEKNKEESAQPNTEPPVEGPNGDVAQEEGNGCEAENQKPDEGAPETIEV